MVELAVGIGRVAVAVARAIGRRVIGVDRSPTMLEQARAAASEAGVELDLRLGDMRDVAGLEVEALYGWFDRRRFDEESREFVWVTRRPSE